MKNLLKVAIILMATSACTPEVSIKAPEKPIEINLNVNIEHKIKVEIEKDVKDAISNNPRIF
jgi:hypothetical protein